MTRGEKLRLPSRLLRRTKTPRRMTCTSACRSAKNLRRQGAASTRPSTRSTSSSCCRVRQRQRARCHFYTTLRATMTPRAPTTPTMTRCPATVRVDVRSAQVTARDLSRAWGQLNAELAEQRPGLDSTARLLVLYDLDGCIIRPTGGPPAGVATRASRYASTCRSPTQPAGSDCQLYHAPSLPRTGTYPLPSSI